MVSHQVVKVVVLNCEPSKERMLLSFRLLSDPKQECEGQSQKKKKAVSAGQVPDFSRQIGLATKAESRVPLTLGSWNCWRGKLKGAAYSSGPCVRAQGDCSGKENAAAVRLVLSVLLPFSLGSRAGVQGCLSLGTRWRGLGEERRGQQMGPAVCVVCLPAGSLGAWGRSGRKLLASLILTSQSCLVLEFGASDLHLTHTGCSLVKTSTVFLSFSSLGSWWM